MRLIVTLALGLFLFASCNRNTSQANADNETEPLISYKEYSPNPDEVVISAKLISFEKGIANVEVVEQLKVGHGANVVLSPGNKISVSSSKEPANEFICAIESLDSMGQNKQAYRITRFLK
ncbi:hypothetical protein [Ekhidna sp.]|uniref:hypothetical protein n=1 Tax=Ekhidna sp. TaxID=2608089 RepID=UPI003B5AEEEA